MFVVVEKKKEKKQYKYDTRRDGATKTEIGMTLPAASTWWAPYVMLIGLGTVIVLIANCICRRLPVGCSSRWLSAVFLTPQPYACKLVAEADQH